MYQKILWKIESLWAKYKRKSVRRIDFLIDSLYENNISKHNNDFRFVENFYFNLSDNIVHSDEYGKYFGLKHSQVLKKSGRYIYLFDNHNKILQPFLEYYEITGKGFDVVHIDAHADDAVFPAEKPRHLDLEKVQGYIEQTRISDFFDFISQSKIIKKIHRYTISRDFAEFKKPENPYILSLDIDIFGPEGDFVDLESKVRIIAKAWAGAEVVCIAMSPGFINQDFAREVIKIFVK